MKCKHKWIYVDEMYEINTWRPFPFYMWMKPDKIFSQFKCHKCGFTKNVKIEFVKKEKKNEN